MLYWYRTKMDNVNIDKNTEIATKDRILPLVSVLD